MNSKTTVALLAALVLCVGGVWWAVQDSSRNVDKTEKKSEPKPLISPAPGDLAEFEIKAGDAPAMRFQMIDEKWRMTAPMAGSAEHYTVNTDAVKFRDLRYERAYAKDDKDRPGPNLTGLDNPEAVVKLTDKTGKSTVIKIGRQQALSSKTYVQKEGDDAIYLVNEDLTSELRKRLSDYRGKRPTEFNVADATRIEVSGEHAYTLVKDNGQWVIEAPTKARAGQSAVTNLLTAISNMNVMSYVEDQPKNLRIYGLDSPTVRVAITTEKKTPRPATSSAPAEGPMPQEFDVETRTIKVAFGATAEDRMFARLDDENSPSVFQVAKTTLKSAAPELADLRDKRVTDIATGKATRLAFTQDGSSVVLVKTSGTWRIGEGDNAPLAEFAAVDDVLRAIRDLNAVGFEDAARPDFGLDSPRATVEITAEGQLEPAKLTIGGETPSRTGVYVRNERDGTIAVVSTAAVEPLLAPPYAFSGRDLLRAPEDRVASLEIERNGAQFTLEKTGPVWQFTAPVAGRATLAPIQSVKSDLANLRGRKVVGRGADAARFGLDKPAMRVKVTVAPPAPVSQPATSQPASAPAATQPTEPPTIHTLLVNRKDDKVYAMVEGGDTICEIDGKVYDDLNAEMFDTQIVRIETSDVTRLAYGGPAPFEFTMSGDTWTLTGESTFPVDPAKITAVLTPLHELKATRFVKYTGGPSPEFGLDTGATEITVAGGDGNPVTLRISSRGQSDTDRYASVSTAPERVFLIKKEDADKLIKQIADFKKAG